MVSGIHRPACAGGDCIVHPAAIPESIVEKACMIAHHFPGGTGLGISTSHAAMTAENLSAFGATLREIKLA
jgi:hypothetical protein